MRFRATIEQSGKTATCNEVPDEVIEGLGAKSIAALREGRPR